MKTVQIIVEFFASLKSGTRLRPISSNEAIEAIKNEGAINIAAIEQFVGEKFKEMYSDQGYLYRFKVSELIKFCFWRNHRLPFSGTADHYFNLSCLLANDRLYYLACLTLEAGLRQHSRDIDLMALFLKYGIKSSVDAPKCPKIFDDLKKIPRNKWTLIAYDCSIEYLRHSSTDDNFDKDKEIETLLMDFKQSFGHTEQPYFVCAVYYNSIQKFDKEFEELKISVSSVKVTPMCSLRLAQFYCRKGECKTALDLLDNCESHVCGEENERKNIIRNLYVLRTFCRMAVYFGEKYLNKQDKGILAKQIFIDYRKARLSAPNDSQMLKDLSKLKDIIEIDNEEGNNS